MSKNKYYIGIDIAPTYIKQAQEKAISLGLSESKYEFMCQGIENLNLVIEQSQFASLNRENTLAFFPFNSFGNREDLDGNYGKNKTPVEGRKQPLRGFA